ncbi:MAG TPA: hypothetical protein VGZ00_11280 [Candidatus Baltobacteraceae bacterium]|nr:hypothetical protein [Candidatus Baltobacteraceae bacterium]
MSFARGIGAEPENRKVLGGKLSGRTFDSTVPYSTIIWYRTLVYSSSASADIMAVFIAVCA